MNQPIRILIVEDSILVRNGIKAVVSQSDDPPITVVGEAGSNAEAVTACAQLQPDVVLLDIRLPDGACFDTCRQILQLHPSMRILILTSHSSDAFVYEAVTAGAHGYLMKEIDPVGLIRGIVDVAAGKSILSPNIAERVLQMVRHGNPANSDELGSLSPQETRVLAHVAKGLTNKQVGVKLSLSENTVKNYLINIFEKLQVKRRAHATAIYIRNINPADTPGVDTSQKSSGFSLIEVMLAAIILVLGITTAITTLQRGLLAVDSARNYSYAAQLMQSELERLRLKNWSQLQALQSSGTTAVTTDDTAGSARTAITCNYSITDVKSDMKEITLISNWRGLDGRPHTARLITRYSKRGLYDYFYTAH
ncbi:MAG: response regulator [Cephaloticoccus sp.]|nr:response regulator [Cephaloticoccus sp.]MCF7761262.1 response regulator [Cephaloticoccus sp.]